MSKRPFHLLKLEKEIGSKFKLRIYSLCSRGKLEMLPMEEVVTYCWCTRLLHFTKLVYSKLDEVDTFGVTCICIRLRIQVSEL